MGLFGSSTAQSGVSQRRIALLEQKVDIRLIQVLLGHKKLETTALYAQVATDILREVVSPLEKLNSP